MKLRATLCATREANQTVRTTVRLRANSPQCRALESSAVEFQLEHQSSKDDSARSWQNQESFGRASCDPLVRRQFLSETSTMRHEFYEARHFRLQKNQHRAIAKASLITTRRLGLPARTATTYMDMRRRRWRACSSHAKCADLAYEFSAATFWIYHCAVGLRHWSQENDDFSVAFADVFVLRHLFDSRMNSLNDHEAERPELLPRIDRPFEFFIDELL